MRLKEQYQESVRLKEEINRRLKAGTDFRKMKELMLFLARDKAYSKLKSKENQLIMLECFFHIWLKEKRLLPELGIESDIFGGVSGLEDVERKYRKVQYCGLRIENQVPEIYRREALKWLREEKVSGLAIGRIIILETRNREENLLHITRYLREKEDTLNALWLIQYANETFPGQEELLWEEADIWLSGQQRERALEALEKVDKPSQRVKERIKEIRQVTKNG